MGFCLWFACGTGKGDLPLILCTAVNVVVTGTMVSAALRVRRAEGRRSAVALPTAGPAGVAATAEAP